MIAWRPATVPSRGHGPLQEMEPCMRPLLSFLFIASLAAGLAACGDDNKGPMEKTGESIDKAAEKTGEAVKEGAQKTGEGVEKAGEKVQDAAK